jgi:hypothetical protein
MQVKMQSLTTMAINNFVESIYKFEWRSWFEFMWWMSVLQTPSYLISFEWDSCAKIILVFVHTYLCGPMAKHVMEGQKQILDYHWWFF